MPPAPPSGDDEDEDDDGMLRMSFLQHLEELRSRIFKALAGIAIAFVVSLSFSSQTVGTTSAAQSLTVTNTGTAPLVISSVSVSPAGEFAVFPRIEPLGMLIGLYSVRLFALGLPPVMKAPRDRTAAYTLLTSIAAGLIVLVITAIITQLVVS